MRISDWSSDVCSSDLERRSGQGADLGGAARLVARCLVLVDLALRRLAIDDRNHFSVRGLRRGLVLGVDGLDHLLDEGADHRALRDVADAALLGLAGRLTIGQRWGWGRRG